MQAILVAVLVAIAVPVAAEKAAKQGPVRVYVWTEQAKSRFVDPDQVARVAAVADVQQRLNDWRTKSGGVLVVVFENDADLTLEVTGADITASGKTEGKIEPMLFGDKLTESHAVQTQRLQATLRVDTYSVKLTGQAPDNGITTKASVDYLATAVLNWIADNRSRLETK